MGAHSARATWCEFVYEFENWLRNCQEQGDSVVAKCLRLLDETYLLSLPLPRGVVLPQNLGPRNFRFLFRRNVAALLRWTERRSEGESRGFSDAINSFIRHIWWPDSDAKALHRPTQSRGDQSMEEMNQVIVGASTIGRGRASAAPRSSSPVSTCCLPHQRCRCTRPS